MNNKNDKNEIKKQVIYSYVCYWPGLEEDCSSRRGNIVSRSLSRGFKGFSSLSFKHGFFFTMMMRFCCVYSEKLHFFFSFFFLVKSTNTKGQEKKSIISQARERGKNFCFFFHDILLGFHKPHVFFFLFFFWSFRRRRGHDKTSLYRVCLSISL